MSWLRTLLGIVALVTLSMVVHPPSVLAFLIEVRSGPGMTYEVVAKVPSGGGYVAVAQEQDWYKIQLPDGREGWIHRFYAGQGQPPSVQEQSPSRAAPVVATPPATPSPMVATPPATPSYTAPPAASAMPSKAQPPAVTPSRPAGTGPAPPMSRRTALVIGNGAYAVGPLQNAVKDATDITAMLRRLSFEVILLQNAPLQEMEDAVNAFNLRLREGGMGLFYFAGHGVQADGENYLIPVKARIDRQQDVRYQALPMGRVIGAMEDANNGLNLLILDACRNMPFSRSWRSSQGGLAAPPTARGMLIAYATSPGGMAADGAGENGVYTKYLLQTMALPGLSIEQVFKQVRYGVVAETEGKQTPWESSSLLGDFAFMPAQADLVPAGVPPYPSSASDPETVLWSMSERSSHPEDVLAFLQAYPESRFAPAARLRLQQLQQQSTLLPMCHPRRCRDQRRRREQQGSLRHPLPVLLPNSLSNEPSHLTSHQATRLARRRDGTIPWTVHRLPRLPRAIR